MIFGRNSSPGREIILIGLSAENLKSIADGQPLSVGPMPDDPAMRNVTVVMLHAETEKDIRDVLEKAKMVPPETE